MATQLISHVIMWPYPPSNAAPHRLWRKANASSRGCGRMLSHLGGRLIGSRRRGGRLRHDHLLERAVDGCLAILDECSNAK